MAYTRDQKDEPLNRFQVTSEMKDEALKAHVLVNVFINQVKKLEDNDKDVNRAAMLLALDALDEIFKAIEADKIKSGLIDDQGIIDPLLQEFILLYFKKAINDKIFVDNPNLTAKLEKIRTKLCDFAQAIPFDAEAIPFNDVNLKRIFDIAATLKQINLILRLLPNDHEKTKKLSFKFLLMAIAAGWIDVIEWAIDWIKHDVVTDTNGNNILHLAAMYGSEDIIEYIVNKYYKLTDLQNKKTKLPHSIARDLGRNDNLVQFLRPNMEDRKLVRCNDKPPKKLVLSDHELNVSTTKVLEPIDPKNLLNCVLESKATQEAFVGFKVPELLKVEIESVPAVSYKAEFIIAESDLIFGEKMYENCNVFEGTYRSKQVVIKSFDSSDFFIAEANFNYTLFQNPHPQIVHPFGICTSARALVMERADFCLDDLITNKNVVVTQGGIVRNALQIAKGLEHLHQDDIGIVHRDIKPANIVLVQGDKKESPVAKICDFGISMLVEEDKSKETICGTGPYMAPEIFARKRYSPASDMWAFGVTCWEMVARTRFPLFALCDQKNKEESLTKIAAVVKATPMETYLPKVNSFQKFSMFALSCLHPKPNQRPTALLAVERLTEMNRALSAEEASTVVPIGNVTAKC